MTGCFFQSYRWDCCTTVTHERNQEHKTICIRVIHNWLYSVTAVSSYVECLIVMINPVIFLSWVLLYIYYVYFLPFLFFFSFKQDSDATLSFQITINTTNAQPLGQQLVAFTSRAAHFTDVMDVIFVTHLVERLTRLVEKRRDVRVTAQRYSTAQFAS